MLTLYFGPGSSSMAPHIALHEIGVPFEAKPISFHKREQRDPAFLAINPAGKVPLLLIDGRPLTEVAGILFYLARQFPEAKLLPGNPEAEAHVVSWMSFLASSVHQRRAPSEGPERLHAAYAIAEEQLGEQQWAVGEYSIADIHLFRLYWRMRNALPVSALPRIEAHYARMMGRPAVQKTISLEKALGYELPGWGPQGP